jgi:hypothetical protein
MERGEVRNVVGPGADVDRGLELGVGQRGSVAEEATVRG